jgi:hypothetical protein
VLFLGFYVMGIVARRECALRWFLAQRKINKNNLFYMDIATVIRLQGVEKIYRGCCLRMNYWAWWNWGLGKQSSSDFFLWSNYMSTITIIWYVHLNPLDHKIDKKKSSRYQKLQLWGNMWHIVLHLKFF